MKEMQKFAKQFHKDMGWDIVSNDYESSRASLLNNYMLLTTEVAEVAEELRAMFNATNSSVREGKNTDEAFKLAAANAKEELGKEMADCLAYILKLANFFEIDLEDSFYAKMEEVKNRKNKDVRLVRGEGD